MYGIPYLSRRSLGRMTTNGDKPSPAAARDEVFRALVRAITATDHDGKQRRTAEAIGMKPSTLNGYVNERESNTEIGDLLALYRG